MNGDGVGSSRPAATTMTTRPRIGAWLLLLVSACGGATTQHDAGTDASGAPDANAAMDAASDAMMDPGTDARTDAGGVFDAAGDAVTGMDASTDAGTASDARVDARTDAATIPDGGADASTDAASDAMTGMDASRDASMDASVSMDASTDAAGDATMGMDVSTDAAMDGGFAPVCSPPRNCGEVLAAGMSRGDGTYTVYPDATPVDVYCDMRTLGGGWTLVRNIAPGTTWGPFTDSLALTEAFGTYDSAWGPGTYTLPFPASPDAELLFVTRDGATWCALPYAQVTAPNASLEALNATVIGASGPPLLGAGEAVNVLHRAGVPEDPWVGCSGDHTANTAQMLYGEAGNTLYTSLLRSGGGMAVFVREPAALTDRDADGVPDACDGCPATADPDQTDTDGDGVGDACDGCPDLYDADQTDTDGDGAGDACDSCPDLYDPDRQLGWAEGYNQGPTLQHARFAGPERCITWDLGTLPQNANVGLALTAADPDVGLAAMRVDISLERAAVGQITLTPAAELVLNRLPASDVLARNPNRVAFLATIDDVNAVLGGLSYTAGTLRGPQSIRVTVSDEGASGGGPPPTFSPVEILSAEVVFQVLIR